MEEIPQSRFTDLNKLSISINLGSYTGEFLYWGYFPADYWRNYLHVHSFFEICYAFQGSGVFRINNQEHTVEGGELFVAKPDEPHEIISSDNDPLGIYFWAFTLFPISSTPIRSDSTSKPPVTEAKQPFPAAEISLDKLLYAFGEADCWISKHTKAVVQLLDLLTREVTLLQPGCLQSIKNVAESLVIETARSVTPTATNNMLPAETNDEMVAKIVQYLKDNYARPLQIRDVAAQLHLSERHTSRIFRNAMGVPIQEYLTKLRMSIAKQQLLKPSLSITQIAQLIGYDDSRHFATVFRLHTGLTPTSFRKIHGTEFLNP